MYEFIDIDYVNYLIPKNNKHLDIFEVDQFIHFILYWISAVFTNKL